MSLDDKTIALAFPFLNENGIEFELDAVNLLRLPSSQSKDVIVERTASVGTDVEMFAMLLYLTDDFLRAGTAVCPEAIYTDVLGFQKSEESLMGVCLMKTHIRVAYEELSEDRDELLESDPFRKEAIPLYQVITNYLKENDVTFVNI